MDVKLATQVGRPYDAAGIREDLRMLWGLGRFSDVRAEAVQGDDGIDVMFRVVREPRYGLREIQFDPHPFGLEFAVQPGALITRVQAAQIAASARAQLNARGFGSARVGWRFAPAPRGQFDLMLSIDAGRQDRKRPKAPPLPAAPPSVCSCLFAERREAERKGILDFSAALGENGVANIERGRPYVLGRLTFYGHHHYSDALIRSHFLVDEGAPLDLFLLRQSLVRLNQAALFEPLDERQVHVASNARTGTADVTIYLTEHKRYAWNLSGPLPMSASIAGRIIGTYSFSFHVMAFSTILKLATNKRLLPVLSVSRPFTPGQGWWSGMSFAPQLGLRATALGYASTQFQQRMLPRLAGIRAPDLTVTKGDTTLLCHYPKPRMYAVRTGAGLVLRFAGQLGGL